MTIRPGLASARGVTDAAAGTALRNDDVHRRRCRTCPRRRLAALRSATAPRRSARRGVNHRDHSEFSGASGVYGGSRWMVWIAWRSRSAGSSQSGEQLAELPGLADDDDRAVRRRPRAARRPRVRATRGRAHRSRRRHRRPIRDASYTAIGAVVMCQSGSPVITGRPTTGLPCSIRDRPVLERGVGLARDRGGAEPRRRSPVRIRAASSKRLRMRRASTTRSRPANVARWLACSAGVPGSSVSSSGPRPSCTPAAAICRARASVASA